ncbi:hypothetical protein [Nocardia brevicatena]|uniref:hypothetical protein n=1 Tax=Nocardia brevicatena TaxID=37327 RepID=UPI00031D9311|nr:hypothetical protein [Nocardia brevicatena]
MSNATVTDYSSLVDAAELVVEMLDKTSVCISMAYVRELRSVVSEHHTAVRTLASALLGGHSNSCRRHRAPRGDDGEPRSSRPFFTPS